MMTAMQTTCSACGMELPPDAPRGLCPACLFQLDEPTAAEPSANSPAPTAGPALSTRSFGDYVLLDEIARGGMGIVFRARQVSLDRIVAVKMILFGSQASAEQVRRFRIEASAAGSLQHPNIVAVHEVGLHQGQNFMVMDYVDGPNLARLVQDHPLPAKKAASYLKAIAEAVQFAHERGILHRDLKPSNVLIGSGDRPRVTDFGLAKRFDTESSLTLSGHVIGSPNYLPPEQAGGGRNKVGRASDVYSLGAILYHLLTARPPFRAETLAETLQQVQQTEPLSPRLLNASVPRDLETICLKCLEKEPAKRYATAQALAEELGCFLNNEPIHARPVTRAERAWRWCRRKPALAGSMAFAVVLLLIVAIGSPIAAVHIAHARNTARQNLYAADIKQVQQAWENGNAQLAVSLLSAQRPPRGQDDLRGFEWRYFWKVCQGEQAFTFRGHTEPVSSVAFWDLGNTVASASQNGTVKLWDGRSHRETMTLRKDWFPPVAVAFSPDGQTLAWGENGITLWQADLQNEIARLWADFPKVHTLAFSPDGKKLASAGYVGATTQLKVWELATRRAVAVFASLPFQRISQRTVFTLAFSPDGKKLAVGGTLGLLKIWDFSKAEELATPSMEKPIGIRSLAFSPNGKFLAIPQGKSVLLLEVGTSAMTALSTAEISEETLQVAFSPDGQWLTIGTVSGVIELVDRKSQRSLRPLMGHTEAVSSLAFSPDSHALISGSLDKTMRLWSIAQQPQKNILRGHTNSVSCVALSPDGQIIASGSLDGSLKLWDAASLQELATLPGHNRRVRSVAFSPNGQLLASTSGDETEEGSPLEPGDVKLWDVSKRAELATLEGLTNAVRSVAFSPDGSTVAIGAPYAAELWDVATHRQIAMLSGQLRKHDERVTAVTFSPDSKTLAVGSYSKTIELWDVAGRRLMAELTEVSGGVECLAFSPNGNFLASGNRDLLVRLWNVRNRKLDAVFPGHKALTVSSVAFSPDGKTLASSGGDGTVRLWSVAAHRELATLKSDADKVWAVVFSGDGKVLFSGNGDGTVRLWRSPSFEETHASVNEQQR
jgi:WD40 repeat protein/predicted Ser/Thr protein kinase